MANANKLEIVLSFKPLMDGLNRFTAGINQRLEQVKAFNSQIRNGDAAMQKMLGQVGAVLGAAALARFAQEAREADKVQQQLIRTLERTGESGALDALNAQAAALQKVTLFSDEAVNTVQRLLISFGLTAEQAKGMTELVLDFAQETGQSAEGAAMLIGRTLAGDSEELGRYKIQLDQTKGKVEALTSALGKFAAGASKGAVADPRGRAVEARYADATENLGRAANRIAVPFLDALIPVLERVADAVTELAAKLAPIAPMLGDMAAAVGPGVVALGLLAGGITVVKMVINPLRAAFMALAGEGILSLNNRLGVITKRFGDVRTAGVLLKDGFTTWAGAGRIFASSLAVVSAGLAGWELGKMLNEIEVGMSNIKIKDWAALWVFAVKDTIGGAFSWLEKAWVNTRFTIQEGLSALLLWIREKQLSVQEALNKLLPAAAQKYDTTDLRSEIDALSKTLGELEQKRLAAIKAINDARRIGSANAASTMLFIADGDAPYSSGKKAGVGKSGAPRPDLNADKFGSDAAKEKALLDAEELARKRELYVLETRKQQAELSGNQRMADDIDRYLRSLQAEQDLGEGSIDMVRQRLTVEDTLRNRQRTDAEQEQQFSQALGELAIKRAAIEADRYRTAEQKQQALLPLLQEEARIYAEQIAYLEKKKLFAAPSDQLQIQQQIDGLRGQQADNTRGQSEAAPQTMLQGFVQGSNDAFDAIGTKAEQVARGVQSIWQGVTNALQQGLYNVITRTQTLGQGLKSIGLAFGQSMLQAFTQMVAEYAAKKAMMFAIDMVFAAKGLAVSLANAAKSLIAWIPSAIAASISSWGIAAAIGAAAVVGLLAFADGGLVTGPGSGTSDSIPARLSNGEFVVKQKATARFGSGFLEGINNGILDLGALPGNVAAGMAVPEYGNGAAASGGGGGQDMGALVDAIARKINITAINVPDERAATRIDRRSRAAGDVVAIFRANRAEIMRQGPS